MQAQYSISAVWEALPSVLSQSLYTTCIISLYSSENFVLMKGPYAGTWTVSRCFKRTRIRQYLCSSLELFHRLHTIPEASLIPGTLNSLRMVSKGLFYLLVLSRTSLQIMQVFQPIDRTILNKAVISHCYLQDSKRKFWLQTVEPKPAGVMSVTSFTFAKVSTQS